MIPLIMMNRRTSTLTAVKALFTLVDSFTPMDRSPRDSSRRNNTSHETSVLKKCSYHAWQKKRVLRYGIMTMSLSRGQCMCAALIIEKESTIWQNVALKNSERSNLLLAHYSQEILGAFRPTPNISWRQSGGRPPGAPSAPTSGVRTVRGRPTTCLAYAIPVLPSTPSPGWHV